jgi:predicted nucleic acid-binding protein
LENSIIISDTSCLIALDRIDHLHILQNTFETIYSTPKVLQEFCRALPNWIIIKEVENKVQLTRLELILDAGEASAISLALETENAVLIIDEKKGRRIATELNLNIIGTLKVLLLAKQSGIIESVKDVIQLLTKQSFRFNSAIVKEILILAEEN